MDITFRSAPEFASVDVFVAFLCDDDRTEYTCDELAAVSYRLRLPQALVRAEIEAYGVTLAKREPERRTWLKDLFNWYEGPTS